MRFFIWEHYKQRLSNQDAQFKESQQQQRNKQKAAFINSKNILNASILWKRPVYPPRPSREAPTDVFYSDTVHFWSTHLLQNLHGLLRIVTLLADHVNWREKPRETHYVWLVETQRQVQTGEYLKTRQSKVQPKFISLIKERHQNNVLNVNFCKAGQLHRLTVLVLERAHIATPLQPVSSCPK